MSRLVLLVMSLVWCRASTYEVLEQQELSSNASTDMEMEEKMRELRIQMVKLQILSKLNLNEAPPSVEPAGEAAKEMIRLLMNEEEERRQNQLSFMDTEDKLVFYSKGNGQTCLQYNGSNCKMFRYELSASLNMSSMDIWIYKMAALPKWVSVSLAFSSSSNEDKYFDTLYYELYQSGWIKLQLPRIRLPSSWNDSVLYSAEVRGQNIEAEGNYRPFLTVSKSVPTPVRQRRDVDCNTNESCCLKSLRFSFAEIGFDWVLYPEELEANMCTGKCTMDHSAMGTHYERAMAKVLEGDSSLHASLGECWTLCCKPKILEPVQVIYNDTDGIMHVQHIPELSVKSCSCS